MNKKELLEQKEIKTKEFNSLVDVAESAKRELNTDEVTQIDKLKDEVRSLDAELDALETAENAKRDADAVEAKKMAEAEATLIAEREAKDKELKDELTATKRELSDLKQNKTKEMKENKFLESVRGVIATGGEMIATRDAVDGDTTAMAEVIPKYVEGLDIIGYEPIWKQMGATILSGAKGTFNLPYADPIIGAKLAELAAAAGDVTSPSGILVTPERFVVQKTFSSETLNSATDNYLQSTIGDMVKGCDRAITKEVYVKLLAYASEVAGVDITKAGFDALMAGTEVELGGSFFANRASFFEAKGVAIDTGSGRFLVESMSDVKIGKGMVYDGTPFWYSNLFEDGALQQYVVYGDTEKIHIAEYDKIEIIVDKYTLAAEGQTVITVVKHAHVTVTNPAAFSKSPDLDPAV